MYPSNTPWRVPPSHSCAEDQFFFCQIIGSIPLNLFHHLSQTLLMGLAVLTELKTKWDSDNPERITWTLTFDVVVFSGPGIPCGIRDARYYSGSNTVLVPVGEQGSKGGAVVRVLPSNQGGLGPSPELTSTPYVACPPPSLLHQSNGSTTVKS